MDRRKRILGSVLSICLVLLITAGAAWGGWRDAQEKFRDVTISTGETQLELEWFLTEFTVKEQAAFVTDIAAIDCAQAGIYPITLRYGQREKTVNLTVEDTAAPVLTVQNLILTADQIPAVEDFVTELQDHSQVFLSFAEPFAVPEDFSDVTVQIVAADAYGNETRGEATVSFLWLRDQVTLEYGKKLKAADLLYGGEESLLKAEELAALNEAPVGTHTISSTLHGKTLHCTVLIQDTTGPILKLKEHKVRPGGKVALENFVEAATDLSGEVKLSLLTQLSTTDEGEYTVVIEAEDLYGNKTTGETILRVNNDISPPVILGADKKMNVEKYSEPDYAKGITVYDGQDRNTELTIDAGMVDLTKGGTYYVTYIARDSAGNETRARRQVVVAHDQADTDALAAEIAATLPDDPEAIRDYVRDTIIYSTYWGGNDPIWFGFQNRVGNCYVHAVCLKALLDEKGYNTQLIWVTERTHYWLVIEIEPGVWRHIDATPGTRHTKYSLMTDEQRLETLSGRWWYYSEWPACE